jgi:hypothetical protein
MIVERGEDKERRLFEKNEETHDRVIPNLLRRQTPLKR